MIAMKISYQNTIPVIPLLPSFDKLIEVWGQIRPLLDISLDQTHLLKEKGGGKK
jgi:hypothetical protein